MPPIEPANKLVDRIVDDLYTHLIKEVASSIQKNLRSLDLFRCARKRYFDSLTTRYGHVRILGMSSPMPIQDLFIPVRVSEETRARKYMDEDYMEYINEQERVPSAISRELARGYQRERSSAVEIIEDGSYFIVLGGPGSGKSTLLRYLALLYSGRVMPAKKQSSFTPLFPILVTFREAIERNTSIAKMLRDPLRQARIPEEDIFLNRLLDSGSCMVLFDGFDELSEIRQGKLVPQINELVTQYPDNTFLISSRTADPLRSLQQFTEIEICEFAQDDVSTFTANWFRGQASDRGKQLAKCINNDIHLKELATTPLLLSLICILYKYDLRIPTNRSELYDRCIECLLREWDASRGIRRESRFERFSVARKAQFFSELAHDFFLRDKLLFMKSELRGVLTPYLRRLEYQEENTREVLRELLNHHGILVKRSPRVFSFSHLTFQEFFVAKHMVATHSYMSLLEHIASPRWQEVISLTVSMLPDATEFVRSLLAGLDLSKMRLVGQTGRLGYEGVLLRSLSLSEAVLSPPIRKALYARYFEQHNRVYEIPWSGLELDWRFSKKPGKMMIKMRFSDCNQNAVGFGDAMHAFQTTLDLLSLSKRLLRFYSEHYEPEPSAGRKGFRAFVRMVADIIAEGGSYSLKMM